MKKHLLTVCFLLFLSFAVFAQNITIKGTVNNDEDGSPVAGASIRVKGNSKMGTSTNNQGAFTMQVPENTKIITVSAVGFSTTEVEISANDVLKVILKANSNELNQVVVTALGIKKSSKSISYDVQKISSSDITVQKDANFIADLSGKIAGATVNASASGQGGSVRVVLRGIKSISGNNNALYVVDGIPLQDLRSSQPSSTFGGTDGGEGISSINPDDIADIQVLSGPSAAALYGFQGANGVILITTKKGAAGKVDVNFSSNVSFSNPFVLPKLQNTYGAVPPADATGNPTFSSYGEKLSQPSSYRAADFFQTGAAYTNSVNVTSGNDKTQNYFSAGSVNSTGVIKNNDYSRYNFTDRVTTELIPNKLILDASAMYAIERRQNSPGQGQYNNPLIGTYLFPPGDIGTIDVKNYERFDITRNFNTQYWPYGDLGLAAQNPYWIINRQFDNVTRNRFQGSASLKYTITEGLNLTGRVKYDNSNDANTSKKYASTLPFLAGGTNGSFSAGSSNSRNTYADLILNYVKKLGTNFSLNATLGASIQDGRSTGVSAGGSLSVIPNFFSLANVDQQHIGASYSPLAISQNQAVFASGQLGYKDYLFLEITGRNDWNSALYNTTNTSIFYPSLGLSAVLSDMVKLPKFISYAKLRASIAGVGNPPPSYQSNPLPTISNGTISTITAAPFTTLKPERTRSIEGGADLRLFKDAVNLSITYYNSSTTNQIFSATPPVGVGYSSYFINAGQINNQGVQATLGYTLKSGQFTWNPNLVFSLNRNKVAKLLHNFPNPYVPGTFISIDTLQVAAGSGFVQRLVAGQPAGEIYVNDLLKDANGKVILDAATGLPSVSKYLTDVGSSNPNSNFGFNNKFSYKNFNLSFLINARFGGKVVSATQALLDQYGVSQTSADARNNGGIPLNGSLIDPQKYYNVIAGTSGGSGSALALYTYSATNVRLGELSFGYTIPSSVFHNKIKSINISLVARNLWMIYNKAPFDPELAASTSTYYQGFDYFNQPSLRNIGFKINLSL